ncbi:MAG TPA: DnaJ domain-containing protein [Deltaproteobacteria bacterium]|mgnify:CR=1 FL=1|nr:DnaJ domain-containing protein [Deltaproteobacteria bacterium]
MTKDYYRVLGVCENASPVEIKKAYRKLALQFHPDVSADATRSEEDFRNITEAYGVLIDPAKKKKYDSGRGRDFQREEVFQDIFSHSDFRDVLDDLPIKREWLDKLFNISRVIAFETLVYGGGPRAVLKRSLVRLAAQSASRFFHNVMDIHENITVSREIASQGGYITIEYRPGFSLRRIRVSIPRGIKKGTVLRVTGMGRTNFRKRSGDLYLHVDIASS